MLRERCSSSCSQEAFECRLVAGQLIAAGRFRAQRLKRAVRGEHARFHRGVAAFDLQHIEKTGIITNEQPRQAR